MELRGRWRGAPRAVTGGSAVGVVLVVAALLAGCTGGDERSDGVAAPVSTQAPPSASPSVSVTRVSEPVPTVPYEATRGDLDGAKEFIRYWFEDVYTYVSHTNDVAPMKAISDKGCEYCASIAEAARDSLTKKSRQTGGQIQLKKLFVVPGDHEDEVIATVVLSQATVVYRDTPTSKPKTYKKHEYAGTVRIVRREGRWVFYAFRYPDKGGDR